MTSRDVSDLKSVQHAMEVAKERVGCNADGHCNSPNAGCQDCKLLAQELDRIANEEVNQYISLCRSSLVSAIATGYGCDLAYLNTEKRKVRPYPNQIAETASTTPDIAPSTAMAAFGEQARDNENAGADQDISTAPTSEYDPVAVECAQSALELINIAITCLKRADGAAAMEELAETTLWTDANVHASDFEVKFSDGGGDYFDLERAYNIST